MYVKITPKQYFNKVSSVAVAGMLLLSTGAFAKDKQLTLESMKLSNPITLEATNPIWNQAKPLKMTDLP